VTLTLVRKIVQERYTESELIDMLHVHTNNCYCFGRGVLDGVEKVLDRLVLLWTVKQLPSTKAILHDTFPANEGPEIITVSTEVPKDSITQSIATAGIIGLCTSSFILPFSFLSLKIRSWCGTEHWAILATVCKQYDGGK